MKNQKLIALLTLSFIIGASVFLLSFKKENEFKVENQMCYGATITTDNLHNARITGRYNPDVYGLYANSWFKHYTLTVSAPNGWHFTGEPLVNCVRDDRGAFAWNNFPAAHDRFFLIQRNPKVIIATCWAGSRSIQINLACQATKDQMY